MNKLTVFWLYQGETVPQFGIAIQHVFEIDVIDESEWEVKLFSGQLYTLQGDDLERFKLLINEAK